MVFLWSKQKYLFLITLFGEKVKKKCCFRKKTALFWSECRDSNPGPLGPEGRFKPFSGYFVRFLTISTQICFIFRPLGPPGFHVFRSGVWYVLWSETLPILCRCFAPTGKGSVFCVSGCLYCNSVAEGGQVISASYMAQRLRDCKQKKHSPYQILSFGISRST